LRYWKPSFKPPDNYQPKSETKPSAVPIHLRGTIPLTVLGTGAVAFMLGIVTAYGQAWLPQGTRSLANSTGSWALAAFALALLAPTATRAAITGSLSLVALVGGYVTGAAIRGLPASNNLLTFWTVAALTVGPGLGLGAHWVGTQNPRLAPIGLGAMSGILVGEGAYGLSVIANTTSPPFWVAEIAGGVALLVVVGVWRLTDLRAGAPATLTTLAVASTFLVLYRLDLIAS
jgi:hypothetical protein